MRFAPAVKVVQYWCQRADAEAGHDGTPPADQAHLHVNSTLDGTVAVNGVLDAVGGEIVTNELERLEHDLYLADQRAGHTRTTALRRAEALVVMATRSATRPASGRAPKPLFTVLVGEGTVAQLCELAGSGTVVHPRQLAPWLSTAMLESVLFDGPTTIISVSRKRSFTGATCRAVEVRDRTCQHPSGCDVPAHRCDVDHTVPWSQGGVTSQFSGRLECPTQNRDHERQDHGATPLPERHITRLDELRARLRWRLRHEALEPPGQHVPRICLRWPRLRDHPDEPGELLPRGATREPPGTTTRAS